MFNSSILDAAVGLLFVFLLVSTVCAAMREALEHVLKTRASYLECGIRELHKDAQAKGLAKQVFDHPLIQGYYQGDYAPAESTKPRLWRPGKNLPSYIPTKNFALALLDLAARGPQTNAPSDTSQPTSDNIRATIGKLDNPYVERVVLMALDSAQGNLDKARATLERWYDGAMDRVSGWYKRSTQLVIFGLLSRPESFALHAQELDGMLQRVHFR